LFCAGGKSGSVATRICKKQLCIWMSEGMNSWKRASESDSKESAVGKGASEPNIDRNQQTLSAPPQVPSPASKQGLCTCGGALRGLVGFGLCLVACPLPNCAFNYVFESDSLASFPTAPFFECCVWSTALFQLFVSEGPMINSRRFTSGPTQTNS